MSYRTFQCFEIVAGSEFGPDALYGDDAAGVVVDGIANGEDMKVFVDTDWAGSHHRAEKGDFALDAIEELIGCLVVHCDERFESNIWYLFGSHSDAGMNVIY